MQFRLFALSAAFIAYSNSAGAVTLPTQQTYSAAADIGSNIFTYDPPYTPLASISTTPGVPASIAGSHYAASANTTFGNNHAYAQASTFPAGVLGAASFSGWYDQVTITGGTGTGNAKFIVHLSGVVDVGANIGGMGYTLSTSSLHPSQLTSDLSYFNVLTGIQPNWIYATPITFYLIGTSPYRDTSILFPANASVSPGNTAGIPSIVDGGPLGGDMGFPKPDLILTPGAGQLIDVTLSGSLNFTYGEAFYLIGGLGTTVIGGDALPFCGFAIGDSCIPPLKDGTGPTTLDFSNSASLINIAFPYGATASFASGASYNVTTVPEPGEWMMLLSGLGLVSWAARRRAGVTAQRSIPG